MKDSINYPAPCSSPKIVRELDTSKLKNIEGLDKIEKLYAVNTSNFNINFTNLLSESAIQRDARKL